MKQFPEQASTNWILSTFIYTLGAVAVLLVVAGLVIIDKGLVRRRNVLDTTVQKIGAAMIGGLGTLLIGYPIWQWQFNQAFGVPSPFWQAVKDWWLGGAFTTTASRYIDPAGYGEVELLANGVIFISIVVRFGMIESFLRFHFSDENAEQYFNTAMSVTRWISLSARCWCSRVSLLTRCS